MPLKSIFLNVVLILFSALSISAQKDKVLFTVDGDKVYSSEFSRIYEKNLALINDPSEKSVANYLDLYINYKLKLKEAYDLKMDTVPAYIREFTKYKNQLIQPYLKDEDTKTDLVREAYERMQKEVDASHILMKLPKNASPKDTLIAYNQLVDIRKQVKSGVSFDKLAKDFSQDPSAKKNGGKLGYFTAFQMVYPFESAAYNTAIGEVSDIFKTRFGYHILKVNDIRNARGEVEVAHIMLKGITEKNKTKIENIKKELNQGAQFETLAKNYSQDGGSAKKGGLLPKFGSGRMVKSFENVAFSLEKEGEISDPIKTQYGWHVLKLIKKYPIKSFEDLQEELKKKVEQGQRAKIIGNSVLNKLVKEYDINIDNDLFDAFSAKDWMNNTSLQSDAPFLTIESKKIPVKEFYQYVVSQKGQSVHQIYKRFKEERILSYYKKELPKKYPELGYTLIEYRDGLLLFDLMQKKIWEKAEKDSVGLANYFNLNRDKYNWNERADVSILYCSSESIAKKGKELMALNKPAKEIEAILLKDGLITIKEGVFEKIDTIFPKNYSFDKGISDIYTIGDQFVVLYLKEILSARPKELKEVRGSVISKYQEHIEKNWIKDLKNKYPVKINKRSLKKLHKKYQ